MNKKQLIKELEKIKIRSERANHFSWVGVVAVFLSMWITDLGYPALIFWGGSIIANMYYVVRVNSIKKQIEELA